MNIAGESIVNYGALCHPKPCWRGGNIDKDLQYIVRTKPHVNLHWHRKMISVSGRKLSKRQQQILVSKQNSLLPLVPQHYL